MGKTPRSVVAIATAGAAVGSLLLTGCKTEPCSGAAACTQPIHVVAEIDASPSTPDDETYWKAFLNLLEAHQGQAMSVDVIALGATADPSEVCEPVKDVLVAADPDADDQDLSWTRSARELVGPSQAVFECARTAGSTPGSSVVAFEQARGADKLWLFTDAMFNSRDAKVKAHQLADQAYVEDVINGLPSGDALSGVEVGVFGAGVNVELSNEEMAGLHEIVEAAVQAQQGTLTEWVTL